MKPANGFGLPGELVLAQERLLIRKRNPEFPDIRQISPVHGIKRNPQCPLAVRRFFPRVHVPHPFEVKLLGSRSRAHVQPAG